MLDTIRQPDQIDQDWQPYVDAMKFMEENMGIPAPEQMGRDSHEFFCYNGELIRFYGENTALLHGIALAIKGEEITTLDRMNGSSGVAAVIDNIRGRIPFGVGKQFLGMKKGAGIYLEAEHDKL
jgi:hypothetical protein